MTLVQLMALARRNGHAEMVVNGRKFAATVHGSKTFLYYDGKRVHVKIARQKLEQAQQMAQVHAFHNWLKGVVK